MAPVEATIALSHAEGITDNVRARELYKYYQPNAPINTDTCIVAPFTKEAGSPSDSLEPARDIKIKSDVTSSKVSSPDTALTAFCQLTAWRTGAQRAMISVIDAETQYFIAEGTKTVDLVDNTKHQPGDDIWMGCSSVTKAGRLCERTISVAPTSGGDYPCFIIDDLSRDERFNTLPFVTGPPHLRFYAGVPLITKRGIPIGSLFVVDDRIGHGLEKDKIHFMGTMARTIMRHLEIVREVEEHRRGMKMSRGLASFVEGRGELAEADVDVGDTEGTKIAGQFETDSDLGRPQSVRSARIAGPTNNIDRKEKEYSAALSKTEEGILAMHDPNEAPSSVSRPDLESVSQPNSFGGTSVSVSSPRGTLERIESTSGDNTSETSSIKTIFSRAANLIREAFEVDGGAVFYDAQTGISSDMGQKASDEILFRADGPNDSPGDSLASDTDHHSSGDVPSDEGESQTSHLIQPARPVRVDSPDFREYIFSRTSNERKKTAEILGYSTTNASSLHGDPLPGTASFSPFGEAALHTLLKRYPRGKLWTFDSDGAVSSSSEEDVYKRASRRYIERNNKESPRRKLRNAKAKSDAKFLLKHFPGVRQLLFVPLWDAGRSRWLSGCFAWSTEPTRILSKQSELAFLTAFGNSVMAEWSRIDTEIADQKKGDFIGSISHELRSPLHGILASAEFLEEITDGRSKQFVETIDSCGRTLLDTINHILDYSKINHFEKNWRKTKRSGGNHSLAEKGGPLALRQSDLPMLNLFQDVDISVLCEEVVESVFAGHVFQNVTAQTFDMVTDIQGKMSDAKKLVSSSDELIGSQQLQHSGVSVILDINSQNYHFITQPGALRRLIMNLLGNALKYTSHGYVRIKLDATEMEDMQNPGASGESVPRAMVTVSVTDTGKALKITIRFSRHPSKAHAKIYTQGISPEFLRSKLFTPFAQENSLSSGTGLGLSIVRKIVALLEGEITIDSDVGIGTQVRVSLPLLREMPKTTDSSNSASTKSLVSTTREADEAVTMLKARVAGQKAALLGFDIETKDPVIMKMGRVLKASVSAFLKDWYGLDIVSVGHKPNIIICNEADPAAIMNLARQVAMTKNNASIVVLCSHNSRYDRTLSLTDAKCNVAFVAKPVGPLKLAKAIVNSLNGAQSSATPGVASATTQSESSDLSNMFEGVLLSPQGGEVLDNTRMAADSDNARKALETPTPNAPTERFAEFPFPKPAEKDVTVETKPIPLEDSANPLTTLDSLEPALVMATTEKATASSKKANPTANPKIKFPTLLVVDDNQINLSLLSTYLNRRKYETVHEAQNGLEAVHQFENRPEGYDIIFMDITMPILDGFGATRQIRTIEENRRKRSIARTDAAKDVKAPALIIAFTGRSSIDDQTEAVRAGIDLFMTKPVAFKEVGKIIDNWLANKERERRGSEMSTGASGGP